MLYFLFHSPPKKIFIESSTGTVGPSTTSSFCSGTGGILSIPVVLISGIRQPSEYGTNLAIDKKKNKLFFCHKNIIR